MAFLSPGSTRTCPRWSATTTRPSAPGTTADAAALSSRTSAGNAGTTSTARWAKPVETSGISARTARQGKWKDRVRLMNGGTGSPMHAGCQNENPPSAFLPVKTGRPVPTHSCDFPPSPVKSPAACPTAWQTCRSFPMPTFQLPYHPPYDWSGTLEFLKGRSIQDVEIVTPDSYARTVFIGCHSGEIKVTHLPDLHSLRIDCSTSLAEVLPELTRRVTNLFDLEAEPEKINAHLGRFSLFADSVTRTPGMRVPGAFDGFEMAVRSILGQQITVRAATTLSSRFALAFGGKASAPFTPGLSRITPSPEKIANLDEGESGGKGGGCPDGDLLAQDGADSHLEAIE
ncbi:MAG: hypothetical protein EOP88_23745, partial [Verrucomicrobiaceae bacterium]